MDGSRFMVHMSIAIDERIDGRFFTREIKINYIPKKIKIDFSKAR